jgi:hypothetical protein
MHARDPRAYMRAGEWYLGSWKRRRGKMSNCLRGFFYFAKKLRMAKPDGKLLEILEHISWLEVEGNFKPEILNYFQITLATFIFSLLYICIGTLSFPLILPHVLQPLFFNPWIDQLDTRVCISVWLDQFSQVQKIGSWDKELSERIFFNLAKKIKILSGFWKLLKTQRDTLTIIIVHVYSSRNLQQDFALYTCIIYMYVVHSNIIGKPKDIVETRNYLKTVRDET